MNWKVIVKGVLGANVVELEEVPAGNPLRLVAAALQHNSLKWSSR